MYLGRTISPAASLSAANLFPICAPARTTRTLRCRAAVLRDLLCVFPAGRNEISTVDFIVPAGAQSALYLLLLSNVVFH